MNRKNFQDENSCHDMDVANCLKFTKNFSVSRKSRARLWSGGVSQPLD